MKDEDFIIENMRVQADTFEKNGDIESANMIRDLLPNNNKKDTYKVDINIRTTVEKFDKDMNLIETVRK